MPGQVAPEHGDAAPDQEIDLKGAGMLILALATPNGLKGKAFTGGAARAAAQRGCEMSAYLLATDAQMTADEGFASLGDRTGDLRAVPDPAAVYYPAWTPAPTVLVLADAVDPASGIPLAHAPRAMLRRQVDRLAADHGMSARLGLETEGYAYRITARQVSHSGYAGLVEHQAAGTLNGDYALDHESAMTVLLDALTRALTDSGIPPETVKTEAGPGQIELTFAPDAPLAACDRHQVVKLAVRAIAEQSAMSVSFMALPHAGSSPSGLHLHLSLTDPDGLVFAGDGETLTDQARHGLAGCLDLLPHAALFYAPHVNSYKRYRQPFTPAAVSWGYDNRFAALRITGHGQDRRVEMRLAGADADPHLAAAALLAGFCHGLERRLPLADTHLVSRTAPHSPDRSLPATLGASADRLEQSKLVRAAFGDGVVEHYAHLARIQVGAFERHVTDWELGYGFARA